MQDGVININTHLRQSVDRPVRPDMRPDGHSDRPTRKLKGTEVDLKLTQ